MTAAHVPRAARMRRPDLVQRGVRLGKALQLVNVLRDAPADLRLGRCYLPRTLLQEAGLQPEQLTDASARRAVAPVYRALLKLFLGHVDAAFPYVLELPRSEPRLRLAALWPLWIGLSTVARLCSAADPLDPTRVIKIRRAEVYRILAESSAAVGSDRLLRRLHQRRRAAAG
jgi:farnesyl-diphosphate farnesyltransferase